MPPPGCPPQADPYLLLSLLPGTAFPAVDRLALSQLGARLDSPRRAAAAIEACLRQSSSDGAERRIPWRGRGAHPRSEHGSASRTRRLLCAASAAAERGAAEPLRPRLCVGQGSQARAGERPPGRPREETAERPPRDRREVPSVLSRAQAALERMRKEGLVHADYPPPAQGGAGEAAEGAEAEGAGGGAGASLRDPSLAPYVYHQTLVREEEAVAMAVRRRLPAREQAGAGEAAGTGEAAGLEHAFDERLSTAQCEAAERRSCLVASP